MKTSITLALTLAVVCLVGGEVVGAVKLPAGNFAAGWSAADASIVYDSTTLSDYVNGDVELFLEFGFVRATVQRYQRGKDELELAVFEMKRPEWALGIYLMKAGLETRAQELPVRNSMSNSQLLLVRGTHFVQVLNSTGDKALRGIMLSLGRLVVDAQPLEDANGVLDSLPKRNLNSVTMRVIAGPISLQSVVRLGSGNVMSLVGGAWGVAAEYGESKGSFMRVLVYYRDAKTASQAFAKIQERLDQRLTLAEQTPQRLVFVDKMNRYTAFLLDRARIEILANKIAKP